MIVGSGTEHEKLADYVENECRGNVKLMSNLLKDEYEHTIASCDIGMIFFDHRFTIPNFLSRLLAYMQAKLPILAVSDLNTDIGRIVEKNGFGWWGESNAVDEFVNIVNKAFNRRASCVSWNCCCK